MQTILVFTLHYYQNKYPVTPFRQEIDSDSNTTFGKLLYIICTIRRQRIIFYMLYLEDFGD